MPDQNNGITPHQLQKIINAEIEALKEVTAIQVESIRVEVHTSLQLVTERLGDLKGEFKPDVRKASCPQEGRISQIGGRVRLLWVLYVAAIGAAVAAAVKAFIGSGQ